MAIRFLFRQFGTVQRRGSYCSLPVWQAVDVISVRKIGADCCVLFSVVSDGEAFYMLSPMSPVNVLLGKNEFEKMNKNC